MDLIFILVFFLYIVMVVGLIVGWNKAVKKELPVDAQKDNFISVIIPVRNEELIITAIIHDLKNQTFDSFEVVFIDDYSEDKTYETIHRSIADDDRFLIIRSEGKGKKHALSAGMAVAKGDIIVTTDADCCVGPEWLNSINRYFQNDNMKMAFGGVRIIDDDNFLFSSMQAIEFSSLIGTGAATISLGFPTMCNAANLAFRKEIINDIGGFDGNLHIPSGDDEFLLRKVFKKYPQGISFMASSENIVATLPQPSIYNFIQQRIRWAGKWRFHEEKGSKILAVSTIFFQLCLLCFIPFTLVGLISPEICILLLCLKIVVEGIFLLLVTKFLEIRWNWLSFILLQFLYPFYVIFVGVSSHFQSFTWKGRRLKSIKTKVATIDDTD